jgi:hypothetical protein
MEDLRDINNLRFKNIISVDAVSNSVMTINNFNPNNVQTRGGDILLVQFPKTLTYLDAQNSYIKLRLRVENPAATLYNFSTYGTDIFGFNSGSSVMNLFESVELISENGQSLFKELHINEMQTVREYRNNISRKNYLTIMGGIPDNFNFNETLNENKYPLFESNKDTTFYVPITELSPFFNGVLIPDLLMSNAILKITLAKPSDYTVTYSLDTVTGAISPTDRTNNVATLSNVSLILSQKELYPEVREAINKKLKSPEGLEYAYYTNFNTLYKFDASTDPRDFKIPINLSAGKIKYIAIKPSNKEFFDQYIPNISMNWNDFYDAAIIPTVNSYNLPFGLQIRLGKDVMSTYEIKTIPEIYEQTIKSLTNISFGDCEDIDVAKVINKKSSSCVSFYNYGHLSTNFKMISDYGVILGVSFERSECVGLSGLSTGVERVLEVDITNFKTEYSAVSPWYFQVQFLQTANVFADGQIAVNR